MFKNNYYIYTLNKQSRAVTDVQVRASGTQPLDCFPLKQNSSTDRGNGSAKNTSHIPLT